jgi:nucleoid DNA-binding protein
VHTQPADRGGGARTAVAVRQGKENNVTKRELVIEIAEQLGYTQNEVADVVQMTLDTITECLAEGHRLEIRNFGVFEVKQRDARMGRNPRTGQEVPITHKRVASFKPGKALKERVQATVGKAEPAPETTPAWPPAEEAPEDNSNVAFPGSGEQGRLF